MRTVLYMRMSTDKQENSIDSQQNVLEAYAKTNKLKIIDRYIDEGISGRTAEKRPAFLRMIEDSSKDRFDAVLVYDSSRFARNLEESIVYKSVLKRNSVKLISATEPTLDEDSALITDAMLGALNEMYSRKLSKSVKRGMIYNAQQGKYQTPPPFGYRKSNGVMEIVDDEAAAVKETFKLFIDCPSSHSVAVKLNSAGVKKRNAYGWYGRDIKRILQNRAYIGDVNYDGQTYKGTHDAIIDMAMWEKVQNLIGKKPISRHRPPTTYKHWLSGLLKCSHCGGRMNYMTDKKGNHSYRCSKHANGCCQYSNFISVPKLEKLIKTTLENLITDDNLINYGNMVLKKDNGRMEALQASLRKTRAKLARHKEAYSSGVDTLEEYRENKTKCQKEEREITKEIETLSNDSYITESKIKELKESANSLIDLLFSADYNVEQKSVAIKDMIEKINVNKYTGEFTIFYYL